MGVVAGGWLFASTPTGPNVRKLAAARVQPATKVLHAFALTFAAVAVVCLAIAVVGMITGRPGARLGGVLRLAALLCFAAAVALAYGQAPHRAARRQAGAGTQGSNLAHARSARSNVAWVRSSASSRSRTR